MLYNKNASISEAEMEVMRVIWDAGKPLTSPEIIELLAGKEWKQSTILTLIKRLHEKDALCVTEPKRQRNKAYLPAISENDYKKIQTHNFIDKMFMGSVKGMIATLFDDEDVYGNDLNEIKEWLSESNRREAEKSLETTCGDNLGRECGSAGTSPEVKKGVETGDI